MKKLNILIILGFFLVLNCSSQDYIPMLGDSNVWYILDEGEFYMTDIIQTVGDTVIEERQYIITDGTGYLHEDTIERKVYERNPWWNKEILFYDFSLQKGDTILLQKIDNGGIIVDHSNYIVDSTGPFQLIGMESRAIYLTGEPRNWGKIEHPVWIEGLGSLGNLNYPAYGPHIWNFGELSCYYKNGELLYQSSFSKEMGSCNIVGPGSNKNKHFTNINIYPNPFNDQIIMDGLPNWYLLIEIYDIHGRLAYSQNTHSSPTHSINTGHLNTGLYLIRIRNPETGKVATNRIVVKE